MWLGLLMPQNWKYFICAYALAMKVTSENVRAKSWKECEMKM